MKKIILLFTLVINIFLLASCDFNAPLRNKMVDYYSKNENYIELYGVVVSIDEGAQGIILEVTILTENHNFPTNAETGFGEFIIVNYDEYNLNLKANDEITFKSARMYFYNGHYLPIVSLEKNGEFLLTFNDGKENYLKWIKTTFN